MRPGEACSPSGDAPPAYQHQAHSCARRPTCQFLHRAAPASTSSWVKRRTALRAPTGSRLFGRRGGPGVDIPLPSPRPRRSTIHGGHHV